MAEHLGAVVKFLLGAALMLALASTAGAALFIDVPSPAVGPVNATTRSLVGGSHPSTARLRSSSIRITVSASRISASPTQVWMRDDPHLPACCSMNLGSRHRSPLRVSAPAVGLDKDSCRRGGCQ